MQKTIVEMWLAEESIDAIKAATLLSESEVWRVLRQYIHENFWGF